MAEELNYVTVKFTSHSSPNDTVIYEDIRNELERWPPQRHAEEKCGDEEEIYDDVRSKELPCSVPHILQENLSKISLQTPATLAAYVLSVLCVILMSVVIALTLHMNGILAEQHWQNINLTAQNEYVRAELEQMSERAQNLSRERDQLNRTLGQVVEFDNFPVIDYCPQKVLSLCKPCVNGWLHFGSKCYLFRHDIYSSRWKTWEGSVDDCRLMNARLLLIESQEEQDFVTNHTYYYNDAKHGYWIGLSKNFISDKWNWNDGRNLTLPFWRKENDNLKNNCALTTKSLPKSRDNWSKAKCDMKNRYICQTHSITWPDPH
ncbi:C-type lectin domain family 1 member A-like [Syngnathus typhle]|uniref:C-type lectin domain family 1 member A-like n=1 Tax=Syngnathus typhle TaxID=161592 RepID=UPI002A69DEE0|nr:C-type lectin domain family 1 member A-like [Syngnathus typhle]XP_061146188.1 C-type lectin domain family 1 member A-like [Syngnathus typhle]